MLTDPTEKDEQNNSMVQKFPVNKNALLIRDASKSNKEEKSSQEAVMNQTVTSFLKFASNLGLATQKTPTDSRDHNSGLQNNQPVISSDQSNNQR